MDSEYGDIMPSRISGITIYPQDPFDPLNGKNSLTPLKLVPQWELSHLKLDSYALNYTYKPNNRWIDFKAGIWLTDADTRTHNSGGRPLGIISSYDKKLVSTSLYRSSDKRYGMHLSNKMQLTDSLALTLSGSAQKEKLTSPDDWWRTEYYDGMRMMPQQGTREEYKFDFNFDWQPTDKLTLSAGARYNSYWSKDDGLQQLLDSDSPNKDFFHRGMTYSPLGWRIQFVGGEDSQGKPYKEGFEFINGAPVFHEPGYYDIMFNKQGKVDNLNDIPFINGEAEKNGWAVKNMSPILPGALTTTADFREDRNKRYPIPVLNNNVAKKRAHAWSPVFSIAYKLTDNDRIYARYAKATHMPSLFATAYGFGGYSPLNTEYLPEESTNIEIGYTHDFRHLFKTSKKADIKIAYYHNSIKNAIDRSLDLRFSQLDKWTTSGIELQARYDNGSFFSELGIARRLKNQVCDQHNAFMANLGVQFDPDKRTPVCVDDGFQISYTRNMQQPLWTFDWTIGGRFFDQKLETGTRLHYHSAYQYRPIIDSGINDFNKPLPWHGVFLVDGFLRYNFKKDFSMELIGSNLTNRYYLDPLSRSPMPAPGRTIKLGISKKF